MPKEKREEVVEAEVVAAPRKAAKPVSAATEQPPEEMLEEKEGFGVQMDEFLQELHISRAHIFYGIGCLVLVIVLIFGGIYGVRWYKNRAATQTQTEEKPKQASEQPSQPSGQITGKETGIQTATDVGKVAILNPATLGETGITAGVAIGMQAEGRTPIAFYIMTFRRLQNAYGADINELLNKSTDRRSRLRGHLALLRKLYQEGSEITERIKREMLIIETEFEPQRQKQTAADSNFFEQLNALNAQTAEDVLTDFIDASREVVALRGRHKALEKIQSLFTNAMPKLSNRIRDIELNEEALVAGIKVYDVSGSSLQLVVPVEGQSTQAPERFDTSAPSIPLIPVHPSQINVGTDFITKPGGGF